MKTVSLALSFYVVLGVQTTEEELLEDSRVFPRLLQPLAFKDVIKNADVVAVVRVLGVDKIKGGGVFLESRGSHVL